MAIQFEKDKKIFVLETKNTTYQMQIDAYGYLLHLYYGAKVNGTTEHLMTYYDRGFSGNPYEAGSDRTYSLDALPQEYPSIGTGDFRKVALNVQNADGTEWCNLHYEKHEIQKGKYALKGLPAVYATADEAQTLVITMVDSVSQVQVELYYGVLEDADIITRSARIINNGNETIKVEKAGSACLDLMYGDYDLLQFYGRHAMERNMQRTAIGHGCLSVGSRRGTSSHQYNPGVVIAEKNTTEDSGSCYGMLFVYSGNFMCEAEKDQYNQTRVIMGLQSELFHYTLEKGESFVVPETILCYSENGLGELSRRYHRCIMNHICRGKYVDQVRPVLINSWEAAYFDFTGETIVKLAKDAAALGIDLVVMDDGWFGKRDDDNSGLGDWYVNEKKLGCTLGEMIERINKEGVKFGIWIEPEMVSEDSDLYRKHPDWALQIPGRAPVRSRNQLVLDFSRQEVRDCIFEQICKMLDQGNIEYIKWDMNRSIAEVCSSQNQPGKVTYDYVKGVYDFLEKLLQKYPDILVEGCSGGGGRFDAGMMYYTPQIWCSDNTDAVDRVRIQHGSSFFYPVPTMGAHVSAVPNHQTGRKTSLHTRGVVAMAGTFGYELDPAKLSAEEQLEIKEQIKQFKEYAPVILKGDYYRLSNPFEDAYGAWQFNHDGKTLLNVVMLEIHGNMTVSYVKLKGLKSDAMYQEKATGKIYSGSVLMQAGIPIPVEMGEYLAYQMLFEEQ